MSWSYDFIIYLVCFYIPESEGLTRVLREAMLCKHMNKKCSIFSSFSIFSFYIHFT